MPTYYVGGLVLRVAHVIVLNVLRRAKAANDCAVKWECVMKGLVKKDGWGLMCIGNFMSTKRVKTAGHKVNNNIIIINN